MQRKREKSDYTLKKKKKMDGECFSCLVSDSSFRFMLWSEAQLDRVDICMFAKYANNIRFS